MWLIKCCKDGPELTLIPWSLCVWELQQLNYGLWSLGKEIFCPRPFGVPRPPLANPAIISSLSISKNHGECSCGCLSSHSSVVSLSSNDSSSIPSRIPWSSHDPEQWLSKSQKPHFILNSSLSALLFLLFFIHWYISSGPANPLPTLPSFCNFSMPFSTGTLPVNTRLPPLEFSGSSSHPLASLPRLLMISLLSVPSRSEVTKLSLEGRNG